MKLVKTEVDDSFPGLDPDEIDLDEYETDWQQIQELEKQKIALEKNIQLSYFNFTQKWWK